MSRLLSQGMKPSVDELSLVSTVKFLELSRLVLREVDGVRKEKERLTAAKININRWQL